LSDNEPSLVEPAKVRRILLCSGKLFYVLAQARREAGIKDIALIRIEQFYPLPDAYLEAALKRYLPGTEVFWTQEEPDNMGACRHLRARFGSQLFSRHPFACISRAESASPATGSARGHRLEQEELLKQALDITEIPNHVD
jgi:2-oxoglutarate dehydrogenase E1 component